MSMEKFKMIVSTSEEVIPFVEICTSYKHQIYLRKYFLKIIPYWKSVYVLNKYSEIGIECVLQEYTLHKKSIAKKSIYPKTYYLTRYNSPV